MTEELDSRRGVVTTEDDGRQRLEFRRTWPDPIDDVWSALTEPDRMARWIGVYRGERAPGGTGTFAMTFESTDGTEPAGEPTTILECDPPRRLVLEVQLGGDAWRMDLDLWQEDGRTVLRFVQMYAAGAEVTDFALGWHWYLDKLGIEVTGGEQLTDWDAFVAANGAAYGRPPS